MKRSYLYDIKFLGTKKAAIKRLLFIIRESIELIKKHMKQKGFNWLSGGNITLLSNITFILELIMNSRITMLNKVKEYKAFN